MIETARLVLRPLTEADATLMLALMNDPDYIANIADRGIREVGAAARYIADGPVAQLAQHGHAMGAVIERGSGRAVGVCGLLKRDFLDVPDLGYAFLPEGRGKGYALEAGRAALADGRDRLGMTRVMAIVNPENGRSIRVLERLGFAGSGIVKMPDGHIVRSMAVDL